MQTTHKQSCRSSILNIFKEMRGSVTPTDYHQQQTR